MIQHGRTLGETMMAVATGTTIRDTGVGNVHPEACIIIADVCFCFELRILELNVVEYASYPKR